MKKILVGFLVLTLFVSTAFCEPWSINTQNVGNTMSLTKLLQTRFSAVDSDIAAMQNIKGTGTTFYVDSGCSITGGDGLSWENACTTLDAAINKCTASRGDVIYVAEGHAETIAAANGFDADIAGITIIGCGNGSNRPTFTFSTTDSTVAIGAAGVTMANLRFVTSVSAVVVGVSVEAAGDYFTMTGCEFVDPGAAAYEFYDMVKLATAADCVTIVGNKFVSTVSTTGCNQAIDIDTGIVDRLTIVDNQFLGYWVVAAIHSDKVNTNALIAYNNIVQAASNQFAIEFTAATTGICAYNVINATSAYEIDEGSMTKFGSSSDWTFDLGTNNLDHLMKTAVADDSGAIDLTEVVDKTVLSWILSSDGDTATFIPSTMALSAQATNIAAILVDTAAMDTAGEVQTLAGTAVVSTTGVAGAPTEKTLSDTLCKDGSFTYDNTTDSLEAIADRGVVILADTNEVQNVTQKAVQKTLTTIVNGNNNLFTVSGGPVKVIEIVAYVATGIESKSCKINYNFDPTDPATDTVFGTDGDALEINGDLVGALYTWNGVVAADLIATDAGVALGLTTDSGIILPPGSLELAAVVSTSASGAITFYVRYMPLSISSVMTAQ
jgi:hypothetical protein